MIRGTCAEFRFNVPYNWDALESVQVIFWQEGNEGPKKSRPLPIKKTKKSGGCWCLASDDCVVVTALTREETARFQDDRKAKAQLKAVTKSHIAYASKEKLIVVYPMKGDVIFDDTIPPASEELILLDGGVI